MRKKILSLEFDNSTWQKVLDIQIQLKVPDVITVIRRALRLLELCTQPGVTKVSIVHNGKEKEIDVFKTNT